MAQLKEIFEQNGIDPETLVPKNEASANQPKEDEDEGQNWQHDEADAGESEISGHKSGDERGPEDGAAEQGGQEERLPKGQVELDDNALIGELLSRADADGRVPKKMTTAVRNALRMAEEREKALMNMLQHMQQGAQPAAQPAQPEETQPPAYEEDPDAYYKWHLDRQQQQIHSLSGFQQQVQQQMLQQQARAQLADIEDQFAQNAPEYKDYREAFIDQQARILKASGYNDAQAKEAIEGNLLQYAAAAYQRGMNPAQALHQFFRQAVATPPKRTGAKPGVSPQALQRNQGQQMSLSGRGVAEPAAQLTQEKLSGMSASDISKLPKAALQRFLATNPVPKAWGRDQALAAARHLQA